MINFWKMAYEAVKKQRDDYKAQRDTLIDDIAVLRANNERLERENEKLKATNENLNNRVRNLNLNAQIQHDELMSCDEEVRYWKDKYTTLTNHIRDMKFASPYSYNYIHLVNFIKELERADDEKRD
ncbi:hypothetical protein [Staphylococcus nepalensis]|uniref:hypothetical protein n=1 Tax=Staphylococcus nepalensis TaxID=214473 RepID=UPI00383B8359